jgi:hypothetical protein
LNLAEAAKKMPSPEGLRSAAAVASDKPAAAAVASGKAPAQKPPPPSKQRDDQFDFSKWAPPKKSANFAGPASPPAPVKAAPIKKKEVIVDVTAEDDGGKGEDKARNDKKPEKEENKALKTKEQEEDVVLEVAPEVEEVKAAPEHSREKRSPPTTNLQPQQKRAKLIADLLEKKAKELNKQTEELSAEAAEEDWDKLLCS